MSSDPNNNIILSGFNNTIKNSKKCTIINGSSNLIDGKSNVHIIGDGITADKSDVFYIGCENGLDCTGDVIAFSQSDRRLKDNIKPIKNCLQKILSLDAIEFDWNNLQETYSGHDVGLIAQQVEVICPEIVETRQNGFKAVKYDKLVTLLVGAIKEQQDIIDEIERKITR
jgi:hypothetical protein